MTENELLKYENDELSEISAETAEAEVETEITDGLNEISEAAKAAEKNSAAAEITDGLNETQETTKTVDTAVAENVSEKAERTTEETEKKSETAIQPSVAVSVTEMPEKDNAAPKKRGRSWISTVCLGTVVIALAITVGALTKLLLDKTEALSVMLEADRTRTATETEKPVERDDLSEALTVTPKDVDEQEYIEIKENGKITYWDSSVGYSWTPVLEGVKQNDYKSSDFSADANGRVSYNRNGELCSFVGIDVSSHQGDINWQLVREDDVEFAFLRIGFRGYGEEGNIKPDEKFEDNYLGASEAGVGTGVYFFSQAVTVEEAVEEAEYVLEILNGRSLDYPVVFDWETITGLAEDEHARTENVSAQTLTLSAVAFCDTISAAGYKPMIYTNKKQAVLKYDLRKLTAYPIWFAYYDTVFDYCYDFDFWQYGYGAVDGIEGDVDLNVAILK